MIQVRVTGMDKLLANLKKAGRTIDELIEEVLDAGAARMTRPRQGGGIGASRNIVTSRELVQAREISTTLNSPRTKGTSWARYFALGRTLPIIFGNVVNKRKRQLEQEWGS